MLEFGTSAETGDVRAERRKWAGMGPEAAWEALGPHVGRGNGARGGPSWAVSASKSPLQRLTRGGAAYSCTQATTRIPQAREARKTAGVCACMLFLTAAALALGADLSAHVQRWVRVRDSSP